MHSPPPHHIPERPEWGQMEAEPLNTEAQTQYLGPGGVLVPVLLVLPPELCHLQVQGGHLCLQL